VRPPDRQGAPPNVAKPQGFRYIASPSRSRLPPSKKFGPWEKIQKIIAPGRPAAAFQPRRRGDRVATSSRSDAPRMGRLHGARASSVRLKEGSGTSPIEEKSKRLLRTRRTFPSPLRLSRLLREVVERLCDAAERKLDRDHMTTCPLASVA
jgi:hypothetical protein